MAERVGLWCLGRILDLDAVQAHLPEHGPEETVESPRQSVKMLWLMRFLCDRELRVFQS